MSEPVPLEITHSEKDGSGGFFVDRDGVRIAEMTYARSSPTEVTIRHTRVDDVLRGHGVARKLLDAAVAWARATGTRLSATCSYVQAQFEKDPSIGDVSGARGSGGA